MQRLAVSVAADDINLTQTNISSSTAFVVAWGGMAAQSARLIGLLILSFELRQLGISRWENIVLGFKLEIVGLGATELLLVQRWQT